MIQKPWKSFFKGKRVTQLGLGLLGRGVNDALFLAKHGVELTVTDKKSAEDLAPSLKKLARYKNIRFVLSGHHLEDFRNVDFVLKGAGVPLDSPEIAEARKNAIPIEMDASLFSKLVPDGVTIVGVTGTRGKSTTAHLIFHILQTARKSSYLAGNVRDMATLPLLEKVRAGDSIVLELDSWQLQGFGDSKLSPQSAIFTTFMDDHLNYYRSHSIEKSRKMYFADKVNIFRHQKEGDTLIVGEQVVEMIQAARPPVAPHVARPQDIPRDWKIKLIGEHNRMHVSCAIAVTRALGISDMVIKRAVASFAGVPGRLEKIRTVAGIQFFNDTTATTPTATATGISALASKKGKHTVLICGGSDKGLDVAPLIEAINRGVKAIVFLPGTGTNRLVQDLGELSIPHTIVHSMKDAVVSARAFARRSDTVLLSTAFASFGLFKNEYDRGDQFDREVKKLK